MPLFGILRAPRNLVIGCGQRAALPAYAAKLGARALVVTDQRLSADADFRRLMDGLASAGIETRVFDAVAPELPVDSIVSGVETGKAFGCDLVIGIGGGSCLDAAKMVALLVTHGGRASDYYGEFKVPGPLVPLILLPTTSGTGSEVTPVAVVSDPERMLKIGVASPHLIAHTAICDPELTFSCPQGLTAVSGADALTHAIEAYTTAPRVATAGLTNEHVFLGKNALSDNLALVAVTHIAASLKRACDDGGDVEARERMMLGATAAGLAFGAAGTAAAHAVQYPVGALTHTPHGAGVAALMPYVMEFNLPACAADLASIGNAMGLSPAGSVKDRAYAAVDAVDALFASIGIARNLADLGVKEEQLGSIAQQALGIERLIKNNPRPLGAAAMATLVRAAFRGDRAGLRQSSEL